MPRSEDERPWWPARRPFPVSWGKGTRVTLLSEPCGTHVECRLPAQTARLGRVQGRTRTLRVCVGEEGVRLLGKHVKNMESLDETIPVLAGGDDTFRHGGHR